jgi:hypothetical protein
MGKPPYFQLCGFQISASNHGCIKVGQKWLKDAEEVFSCAEICTNSSTRDVYFQQQIPKSDCCSWLRFDSPLN